MKNKKDIPKKPSAFLYFIGRISVVPFLKWKYNIKITKKMKKIKEPFIIICNHLHIIDPFVLAMAALPNKLNFVGGYSYAQNKFLKWLFAKIGAIPKFQYQLDLASIKQMLGVVKNGQNLALFPSGRLSTYGENEIVTPALAKMLQLGKVDVYVGRVKGTYLSRPKWANAHRRGRVEISIDKLFSKEEILSKSTKEINEIVQEALRYNEYYDYQDEKQIHFKGKNLAVGLERVLYICPHCHKEHTLTSNEDTLTCSNCNSTYKLNDQGYFIDNKEVKNIYEWSLIVKEKVREEVIKENFELKDDVELRILVKGKEQVLGKGVVSLSKKGIVYEGSYRSEQKTIEFSLDSLISLPFSLGKNFELAYNNDIVRFYISKKETLTKWSLSVEELKKI